MPSAVVGDRLDLIACSGSGFSGSNPSVGSWGNNGTGFLESDNATVVDGSDIQVNVDLGPLIFNVGWISIVVGNSEYNLEVPEMEPPPPAALSCSPGTVTRGGSVTCTVTNATVTQWSFAGAGASVTGPTSGSTWAGPMVISGTVTAAISGGSPLNSTITVNARSPFPQVAAPTPQLVQTGSTRLLPLLTSPPCQGEGCMGDSTFSPAFSLNVVPITGGPNLGLYFALSFSDQSVYPWELNPGLTNPQDPFYVAQSGACWSGVAAIVTAVQNHETGNPSHYTELQTALANNNPAAGLEGMIGGQASDISGPVNSAYAAAVAAAGTEPPGAYQLPPYINYFPYQTCP